MSKPAKILFLSANPVDTTPLLLDEEVRQIGQRIRRAEFRSRFTFETAPALRASDLPLELMDRQPDIVHFSGHGSRGGELHFLSDEDRLSQPVSAATLGRLFARLSTGIKCVVLNACDARPQAEAIVASVPCVIAMSQAMPDLAAIAFAAGFYEALAFGKSIRDAFKLGQLQIELTTPAYAECAAIPILLTQPGLDAAQLWVVAPQAADGGKPPAPADSIEGARPRAQTLQVGKLGAAGAGHQIRITQSSGSAVASGAAMQLGDIEVSGQAHRIEIEQKSRDR